MRQLRNDRSWFQAPEIPACRYVVEIGSAAMLAAKRSAGVAPEVNLWECGTHTPLPSVNYQKSKTWVLVAPQKGLVCSKNFRGKKQKIKNDCNMNVCFVIRERRKLVIVLLDWMFSKTHRLSK